ncbi:DUF4276 family protein [Candidatus Marithrix sp. Canyon 246]|uniref:DUF4276 family protein n=1 Tax=Candidatus Marithrix sp. Canyon 246 TaxID=1827136 RepID=UPI00084A13FF|nr:DUF4276 family protein [Candidatus Marithrix sp. Canyon 246]
MIRINIVVEGHSEEQFVRDILGEYLAPKGIYIYARRVKTGRKSGKDYISLGSLYPYYDKVLHGSLISETIGLKKLRQESPHFDQWISRLENIE